MSLAPRLEMSAPPRAATPARRRPSLDETTTALIPMRPLSVTEAMDAAFLIVRRNARSMLGLPLVVVGVLAVCVLALAALWGVLGQLKADLAQALMLTVGLLVGLTGVSVVTYWLQAMLTRASLQTVLGEQLAPPSRASVKQSTWMLPPMLAVMTEQSIAMSIAATVGQLALFVLALLFGQALAAMPPPSALAPVIAIVGFVVVLTAGTFVGAWVYSWLALTIPIYMAEGPMAPAWAGRPRRPTKVFEAMGRSFALLGWRNSWRFALALSLTLVGTYIVTAIVTAGVLLVTFLYIQALDLPAETAVLTATIGILSYLVSFVVVFIIAIAYVSALQTVFYLDVRMRREALDLGLRFSRIPPPQPGGTL